MRRVTAGRWQASLTVVPSIQGATRSGGMAARRVLIIEDEHDIAELLAMHLQDAGYETAIAGNGLTGLARARSEPWDLVILDLRLPGIEGLEVCRKLRQEEDYVPILMVTSKSSALDRVLGLEIGADDYLTKPFSVSEAVARVRAIFRRVAALQGNPRKASQTITIGRLTIQADERRVSVNGQDVELTAKEFDLLLPFAMHPGRVFRRADLLDAVWGYGHDGYEHTVNSHINRLRQKIEQNPAHPNYVVTVWGVGYKLAGTDHE